WGPPVRGALNAAADRGPRAVHPAGRPRAGVRVVHVGGHPLDALPLLHHLQDGGIVAVQLDRVPRGGRAVSVPFLGRELAMPEGPFALAAIAQVPLVPLFVRRAGYLDYELGAGMPIRLPERATPAELREAAARAAGEMERSVRACPTQWFEFG
ncbi:MAG: hypothetical protein KJ015_02425, partial [Myxococcales bacterium]|nr:hypothetical protein [Myxococcales bacterium]